MRLWHYKLITGLPNAMLVSQWRECIAIKRQWEKGTLKHRLVSYVMDYDKVFFYNYVSYVCSEMLSRGIKFKSEYLSEITEFCGIGFDLLYPSMIRGIYKEHNNRYLLQCYYNLQEKYDRGIITFDEFQKIQKIIDKTLD